MVHDPSTLVNPRQSLQTLSVDQLKCLLWEKGLSVSGKKSIPLTHLENELAGEF
jgi:hypothetical protein